MGLAAGKGRWWASSVSLGEYIPPELVAEYVEGAEKQIAERERIANMTPQQRDNETERLFNQLRGEPGFMEVRF